MTVVAEKFTEQGNGGDLSKVSVQGGVPTVLSGEFNLSRAAFSQRTAVPVVESAEPREPNPFEAIFRDGDRLQKMWRSDFGSHVTVIGNENDQGVTIKVIDMRGGSREIVNQLHIGEKPASIAVSSDGKSFLLALRDSAAEYNIGEDGRITTGFVYYADDGRAITRARYEGDSVKLSFAPSKARVMLGELAPKTKLVAA